MGTVFKRKGRDGKPLRNYSLTWFDHTGKRITKSAGTSDKRAAERILREHEARVAGIVNGTVDLRAERFLEESGRDVVGAVERYLDGFATKAKRRGRGRRSSTTIRDERAALGHFFGSRRAAALLRIADLASPTFTGTVDAVARGWMEGGLTPYTANQRIGAVRRFLAWTVDEGLLRDSPLASWRPYATEPTRVRRPLTDDEVARLLGVAAERGRLLWYLMALRTGLRRSELRRLTWGAVDLEHGAILVSAAISKSRKDAVLPITTDLHRALEEIRPALALPTAPVFPTAPSDETRRKDYVRAGIVPVDEDGRHADFHSLRVTLGTQLAKRGVSPQLTQSYMRHSDYRTTRAFYVHLGLEDLSQAASALEAGAATPKTKRSEAGA